jgi:hypothetical protein
MKARAKPRRRRTLPARYGHAAVAPAAPRSLRDLAEQVTDYVLTQQTMVALEKNAAAYAKEMMADREYVAALKAEAREAAHKIAASLRATRRA